MGSSSSGFQALACFRRAAQTGLAAAEVAMGEACLEGLGRSTDAEEAAAWFEKAAAQAGHTPCEAERALR